MSPTPYPGRYVVVPQERLQALKAAFEDALKANQALQLAQKEWEAKFNAWTAAEYKARYELNVPKDFLLNLETGVFEQREKATPVNPTGGESKHPASAPQQ